MDVVPDTGAVMGVVVISVDTQEFPAAHRHLGDVGHQVIGNAPGVLTDAAGCVGTDGIKIPQQSNAPLAVGMGHAGEDLFRHVLGPAVGVGAATGAGGFPQGHLIIRGIDRSGGREDDLLHSCFLHDLGQHKGGIQVVIVVFPGLGDTLAHSLEASKVNHAADVIF